MTSTPRLRRRLTLSLLAMGVVALGGAAPASADDASVLRAWEINDARFAVLDRQSEAASRSNRAGPLLGVLARGRALARRTRAGVVAQQASTPAGNNARTEAVRSLQLLEHSIVYAYRALRVVRTNRRTATALIRRGEVLSNQAEAAAKLAVTYFRQAGLSPRPIT